MARAASSRFRATTPQVTLAELHLRTSRTIEVRIKSGSMGRGTSVASMQLSLSGSLSSKCRASSFARCVFAAFEICETSHGRCQQQMRLGNNNFKTDAIDCCSDGQLNFAGSATSGEGCEASPAMHRCVRTALLMLSRKLLKRNWL
jgi:hypothetical protein